MYYRTLTSKIDNSARYAEKKLEMGRYLNKIDWSVVCGPLDTCESMWTRSHELVHSGRDIIMPEKQIRIHPTDAPWMNQKLESLILIRQKAFHMHGVIHLSSNITETVPIENENLQGEVLRI